MIHFLIFYIFPSSSLQPLGSNRCAAALGQEFPGSAPEIHGLEAKVQGGKGEILGSYKIDKIVERISRIGKTMLTSC